MKQYFYNEKLPNKNSVVICKIKEVNEIGVTVFLSEYNDIEGMIMLEEVSRIYKNNQKKKFKVGSYICALVLNVDKEKGFIDLSKKQVSEEDKLLCEKKYKNNKKIINMVNGFLNNKNIDYNDFMNKTLWRLDENIYYNKLLEIIDLGSDSLENYFEIENKYDFISYLLEKIKNGPKKIECIFEIKCTNTNGIEDIKYILKKSLEKNISDEKIKINLLNYPQFVMYSKSENYKLVLDNMDSIIEFIKNNVESKNITFNILKDPYVLENETI